MDRGLEKRIRSLRESTVRTLQSLLEMPKPIMQWVSHMMSALRHGAKACKPRHISAFLDSNVIAAVNFSQAVRHLVGGGMGAVETLDIISLIAIR